MKITLIDKMALADSDRIIEYTEPIYAKVNGIYGYIVVSKMNVYFFFEFDGIEFDDITNRFEVIYYTN